MRALNPDAVKGLLAQTKIHHKPFVTPAAVNMLRILICCQNSIGKMSACCYNFSGLLPTVF